MPFPAVGQTLYGGWTQEGENYADLQTRFSSYNTKASQLACDSVADDFAKLNTLVNTTMQPSGGQLDVIGVPRVATNLVIPKNVRLNFLGGAYIAPDGGVTVTINGRIIAGIEKIFGGGGSIAFGRGSQREAYPQWWGALGDWNGAAGTDDRTPLQASIDACLNSGIELVVPALVYKCTGPLFAMKFAGGVYSFCSLTMRGVKFGWNVDNGTGVNSAKIHFTHTDTFGLGIQSGRGVKIKDIVFEGQNDFSANVDGALAYLRTNANFVINGCRDSRFSPYAGVVIDPFGTAVPADGGYPTLNARYVASAGGSSRTKLEGVVSRGFVANFLVSPSGTLSLGSEVAFDDCWSEYGKCGVAICNNQCRNITWHDGSVTSNLYGFDGNTYGNQTGSAPKLSGWVNMTGKYLFNIPQSAGGILKAEGIHAESFFSIGFLGKTFATSRTPAKFIGCEFTLGFLGAGPHADRHLYSLMPVHFDNCSFDTQAANAPKVLRIVRDNAVPIRFTHCLFAREVQNEFTLGPSVNSGALIMDDIHFESNILSDGGTRGPASGNDRISHRMFANGESLLNNSVVPFGAEIRLNNGASVADRSWVGPSEANYQVNHGLLAVVVNGDGTFTFTVPDGTIVRTGDLVYTTTAFSIEKYDGTTETMPILCLGVVTVVAGNNITADGAPMSLVNGNYTIVTFWWPRYHQATTGDVTNASPTILNVSQPGAWKIGQKIRGTGIPTGTYITNIVGATFTLSKNATATNVGTRLYDADVYKVTGTAV